MKYILSFFGVILIIFSAVIFNNKEENSNCMRIHVTANSNSIEDENAKYFVKDAVVEFLIPILSEIESKDEAQATILKNLAKIEEVANMALFKYGAKYSAKVFVGEEHIPARAYGDYVFESGVYESLQIELGDAKGDNWWCAVFPAVCFVSSKNSTNFVYISKILEIINNVTNAK